MPSMARLTSFSSPVIHNIARMEELFLDSSPDFEPYRNGSMNKQVQPIGAGSVRNTTPSVPQSDFRSRSHRLKQLETEKNNLIDDLISQVETLSTELERSNYENEHGTRYNEENQGREIALEAELQMFRSYIERNPFLTVLVDGDSLTFSKDLLNKGETGGMQAAAMLAQLIQGWVDEAVPHLKNYRIHVKIYVQLKNLVNTLIQSKTIPNDGILEDFFKGFSHESILFDLVNTRLLKGSTIEKIKESYRFDFLSVHCNQVFLAAPADEEYEGLFNETPDVPVQDRLTILKPAGWSRDFTQNLNSLHAEDLFMHVPITTEAVSAKPHAVLGLPPPPPTKIATPRLARVESAGSSTAMTYKTAAQSTASTPSMTWAAMTAQPAQSGPSQPLQQPPLSRSSTPSISTPKAREKIARNKNGQRIDSVDATIPYSELQRIKKLKLCNIFYLQGPSYCNGSCNHSHTHNLKPSEKHILREVARMTPCYYKLECTEPGCIYGHRCPQSKPGVKDCYYKDECRFVGWGHGIDEKITNGVKLKG